MKDKCEWRAIARGDSTWWWWWWWWWWYDNGELPALTQLHPW